MTNYEITKQTTAFVCEYREVVILCTLATIQALTACGCCFFLLAILANTNARSQAYNLYLVFLVFPDAFNNIVQTTFNTILAANGCAGITKDAAYAQGWFFTFYHLTTFYLNAVVAYEVHKMVHDSYNRKRTTPPSLKRVTTQAACTYVGAGLLATASLWLQRFTMAFFATILAIISVPGIYVVYVAFHIRKKLPTSGRTKALSLYFMRILIVFFLFYIPGIILNAVYLLVPLPSTALAILRIIGYLLDAMQAWTVLYMAVKKDDIYEAVARPLRSIGISLCSGSCMGTRPSVIAEGTNMNTDNHALGGKQGQQGQEEERERAQDDVEDRSNTVPIWEAEDVYDSDSLPGPMHIDGKLGRVTKSEAPPWS